MSGTGGRKIEEIVKGAVEVVKPLVEAVKPSKKTRKIGRPPLLSDHSKKILAQNKP